MAADSYGPNGEPQFDGSGASADAEDLTLLGEYAAAVGNRRKGSKQQRLTMADKDLITGLEFYETDTGITYLRRGSQWIFFNYDSGWVDLTVAGGNGWVAGTGTNKPQVRRIGNLVTFRGQLAGGTPNTTATNLPQFARPNQPIMKAVALATGTPSFGYIRCFTSGAFQPSGILGPETEVNWITDATV
jgi:hypothetical protein